LSVAAAAGIHRLAIPTPFLVGRVNCYLIEDEPLTLIDTGPNSGKSLDELEQALGTHDHTVEDIELIVVTHQHMDHVGLLEILARRSGAEVAALEMLGPYLADFKRNATEDDDFAQGVMRRHGIPPELATVLGAVGAAFRAFGSGGRVTNQLRDGDRLPFRDRELLVLHRPGHSPSDTIFYDERRQIIIGGDHLLPHISSNALVARDHPRPLLTYMDSMRATRELPAELVLPGHGDPINDHRGLIDERLRMHERRARKLLRLLSDGPRSAYELALDMWGNVAVTQAFLTISEVLGHMDLLVRDDLVTEIEQDGVVRFAVLRGSSRPAF
jgi:glyoxylase-like metal-dependent hydrolase (beta-lactamase superfamily II)